MQFQVPQFIDTEDKIVGPLSLRQFVSVGITTAISAFFLFVLEFWLWIFVSIPILGIGVFIAFARINGRPSWIYIKSLFQNILAPSVYVFTAPKSTISTPPLAPKGAPNELPRQPAKELAQPKFNGIKNLWQQINTSKTAIPKRERALPTQAQSFAQFKEKFEAVRQITGEQELAKRVDYR